MTYMLVKGKVGRGMKRDSKRVESGRLVREPPKHLKFNDEEYEYHRWHWTKAGVLREIKKLRDAGYFARAVIVDPGWATYKRKRQERPRRQTPVTQRTPRITPRVGRLK